MIRAASKNYHSVLVLPETAAYEEFRTEFTRRAGAVSLDFRRRMAIRAFRLTAAYDAMIADYLERNFAG
jgi:phosphoribosylaminoimidazolecarboxamide formyltransferase/IMP cyclohydrolase